MTGSGCTASPAPGHPMTGVGGCSGESYDGGGGGGGSGASGALSWTSGDARQDEPIAVR